MTHFKNKDRIESARLKAWDYSAAGYYFFTICTRARVCCLGHVTDNVAHLSPIGEIVAEQWMKTKDVRPNVQMDEWVIMPNHLHGITLIQETGNAERTEMVPSRLKPNSIGSMIGQIKSNATKQIRAAGFTDFDWQQRFWDEIIWDERGLNKIRECIRNNPGKWESDKDNAPGLWM